jgi:xylulokinase
MGVPVDSVRVSGGGARSAFWRQLLADVFTKRVVVPESQEGSAYGAALLALAGTGGYASVREVTRIAVHEADSVEPQPNQAEGYESGHRSYQCLYPALHTFYKTC